MSPTYDVTDERCHFSGWNRRSGVQAYQPLHNGRTGVGPRHADARTTGRTSTDLRVLVARLLHVGVEVGTVQIRRKQAGIDAAWYTEVLVDTSFDEFDFDRRRRCVVPH